MVRLFRALTTLVATTAVLLLVSAPAAIATESGARVSSKQLANLVSAVRTGADASTREAAAQKIPLLLGGADLSNIDDKTLQDLASLLDVPNDAVRRWVAVSLSMFESKAKFAAPKIHAIYLSVRCASQREPNYAETLRLAILRVGGAPPTNAACLRNLGGSEGA